MQAAPTWGKRSSFHFFYRLIIECIRIHSNFFSETETETQVNCLKITPDKQFLAAAGNPHVRLFEINSQNASALVSYDGHTTNVTDVGEFFCSFLSSAEHVVFRSYIWSACVHARLMFSGAIFGQHVCTHAFPLASLCLVLGSYPYDPSRDGLPTISAAPGRIGK